jgi:hypothetical protein
MSRTNPFWSTAHHSQCVSPAIDWVRTATRRFSQFALCQRVADDLEVLIRAVFGEDVSECLRSGLRDWGPDDNMVSWSLALDIMRLSKSEVVAR